MGVVSLLGSDSYVFVSCCVLVGIFLTLVPVQGQILGCTGDDSCRCTFTDGTGTMDLSSIGNTDGTARFADVFSFDGVGFSFNPCFSFSSTGCSDAAVCQKEASGSYTLLAKQNPMSWAFTGYYPMLNYAGDNGKKVEISMICDPSFETPQLDVFGELTFGTVSMNLWSKCACADTCERIEPPSSGEVSGLTAGSVMLIIFFALLFVYLAAGIAFNYSRTKTVGKDLIPNTGFWATLPGLIKDGFIFTVGLIRGQSRSGYETPSSS